MATTPPAGYFDAGAQAAAPPVGYFDASKAAQPTATPQLSDYLKTDDTGIIAGVRRGISGVVGLPGQVYHAFSEPQTPEEARAMAANQEPIYGRTRGTLETAVHRLFAGPLEQEGAEADKAKSQGRLTNYLGHAAMSFIPIFGPMAGQAVTRSEAGDTTGALSELATYGAVGKAGEAVGDLPGKARPALQKYWNIGPELTKDAVEKRTGQIAEATDKYQAKASQVQQANDAAKQTFLDRGQLLDEAQGHAETLTEHLPKLAEQERAVAKAFYPDVDGAADAADVRDKLQSAIDTKLQGSEKAPAVLTRILKELEPDDPLADASVFRGAGSTRGATPLDDLPPAAKARVMASMSEGERAAYGGTPQGLGDLDFDRLHGYYSELGREMANKDLPGDERAAMASARSALQGEMRKLAEDDGKFGQFTEAQKNWSKYENTFNKTWSDSKGVASPIARALQAKNPVTGELIPERVAQIFSDPKNYKLAQEMLSEYKGAKTDVLQLMKEKIDQASSTPKTLKQAEMPAPPEMPADIDPRALKAAVLKQSAQGLRSMKGIRGALDVVAASHALMGNPTSLIYPALRRGLSYGIESPRVMNYLTKPSEAELQMIKPSKIYVTKADAMAAVKGQKPPSGPSGSAQRTSSSQPKGPSGAPKWGPAKVAPKNPEGGFVQVRSAPKTPPRTPTPVERRSSASPGRVPASGERRSVSAQLSDLTDAVNQKEYWRKIRDDKTASQEDRAKAGRMVDSISGGGAGNAQEMSKMIREGRMDKPNTTITEKMAKDSLMKDPEKARRWAASDPKAQDRMLIDEKNQMLAGKKPTTKGEAMAKDRARRGAN